MADNALETFGRLLMEEVRDSSLERADMILSGRLKSQEAMELYESLAGLNGEQRKAVQRLIMDVVDQTVFGFLRLAEEHPDQIQIQIRPAAEASWASAAEVSDGLAGELFGRRGWIYRFSRVKEGYE